MDAMQEPEVWELLERLSRVAKSHGARCDSVICANSITAHTCPFTALHHPADCARNPGLGFRV